MLSTGVAKRHELTDEMKRLPTQGWGLVRHISARIIPFRPVASASSLFAVTSSSIICTDAKRTLYHFVYHCDREFRLRSFSTLSKQEQNLLV